MFYIQASKAMAKICSNRGRDIEKIVLEQADISDGVRFLFCSLSIKN